MKKALMYGPRDLRIDDVPDLEPGPGEVVIDLKVSSICRTDVKLFVSDSPREYPVGFGHDASGVISVIGPNVEGWAIGDRVVTEQYLACGVCVLCLAGRTDVCIEQPSFYAKGRGAGWFAEQIVTFASHLIRVPDNVSFEAAATIEPILTALHLHRLAGTSSGSNVVVVGAGSMGWGQIQVATRVFGATVVGVDPIPGHLELAKNMGAIHAIGSNAATPASIAATFGDNPPDLVVETSGFQEGLDLAVALTAPGGTLGLVGAVGSIESELLIRRGARTVGLRGGGARTIQCIPGTREQSIALLADGAIDMAATISHRFPLTDLTEAFRTYIEERESVNKMLLIH
jgi:L-iditol 2-dehydrogenase